MLFPAFNNSRNLCCLSCIITAWNRVLEKPTSAQQIMFKVFYGNRSFVAVFARALHLSSSWQKIFQSPPPHPVSIISSTVTHVGSGLPSDFALPLKTVLIIVSKSSGQMRFKCAHFKRSIELKSCNTSEMIFNTALFLTKSLGMLWGWYRREEMFTKNCVSTHCVEAGAQ